MLDGVPIVDYSPKSVSRRVPTVVEEYIDDSVAFFVVQGIDETSTTNWVTS